MPLSYNESRPIALLFPDIEDDRQHRDQHRMSTLLASHEIASPRLLLALSTHRLRRSSQHPPTSQLSLQHARGAQTGHRRHQILGVVTESSEPQSGRPLDDDGQHIRDCRTRIPSSGKGSIPCRSSHRAHTKTTICSSPTTPNATPSSGSPIGSICRSNAQHETEHSRYQLTPLCNSARKCNPSM